MEETGCTADELIECGEASANSTFMSTPMNLFLACSLASASERDEDHEGIREFKFWSLAEVRDLHASGELICAVTMALLFHATQRGLVS